MRGNHSTEALELLAAGASEMFKVAGIGIDPTDRRNARIAARLTFLLKNQIERSLI